MSRRIYVIRRGSSDLHKIGLSSDPIRRLGSLQATDSVPLSLVLHFEIDRPGIVERELHKHFRAWRDHGEWFHLTAEQAESVPKIAPGLLRSRNDRDTRRDTFGSVVKHRARRYSVEIDGEEIGVCSACYQRLRAAGKIKVRPYGQGKPENQEPSQPDREP